MGFIDKIYSRKSISKLHDRVCILGIRFRVRKELKDAKYYRNLPIEPDKIVLRSTLRGYSCNPKYIAEELLRQGLPYRLVWVADKFVLNYLHSFPKNLKLVMNSTDDALREYATARLWIENERRNMFVKKGMFKRPGQFYIQTWHGTFGLKPIGRERKNQTNSGAIVSEEDSRQIDYLISNSAWESDNYRMAFWEHGKILEYGHPRNDILFREDRASLRAQVLERLGISAEKKVVLYAPTWREDGDLSCFSMDYRLVKQALEKKFGGEWVIVARLHYLMLNDKQRFLPDGVDVVNATEYPDMQELLMASDACITDYSSSILDFMLTGRPGFIYAADRVKFEKMRGLCYPLSETPFPLATDNEGMARNIEQFDAAGYQAAVQEFLKGKGCVEDGQAAKRVVELIKEIMADNSNQTETI